MADKRKFHYICNKNDRHEMLSEIELDECPAVVLGSPCKGKLTRVGRGSKTQTKGKT